MSLFSWSVRRYIYNVIIFSRELSLSIWLIELARFWIGLSRPISRRKSHRRSHKGIETIVTIESTIETRNYRKLQSIWFSLPEKARNCRFFWSQLPLKKKFVFLCLSMSMFVLVGLSAGLSVGLSVGLCVYPSLYLSICRTVLVCSMSSVLSISPSAF